MIRQHIAKRLRSESISHDVTRLQIGLLGIGLAGDAFRFAFAWWVLKIHNSALELGTLLTAMTLAQTIAALAVGALGDLLNPMRVLRTAVCAQGLLIAVLAAWARFGTFDFPIALALSVALSLCVGMIEPLASAIIAAIAPVGQITRAIAQRGAFASGGKLFGPMLAGVMVAAFGPAGTLLGASFIAEFSCLIFLPLKIDVQRYAIHRKASAFLGQWARHTAYGLRSFYEVRVDFYLCTMTCAVNAALPAFFLVVLPYLVIHVHNFPPSMIGLFDGIFCAGMFVGGMRIVEALNRRIGKQHAVFVSVIILSMMILTFAVSHDPVVLAIVLFVGGMFMLSIFANIGGLRAVATPADFRTRMFSAASFLVSLSIPPGLAFTTFMMQRLGIESVLIVIATICIVSASMIYIIPNAKHVLRMPEEQARGIYATLYPRAFRSPAGDMVSRESTP